MSNVTNRQIIYPYPRPKKERMTLMTSGSKRRLKVLERATADALPPFRLTRRDAAVMHAIYRHRALTTPQIETLLFPSTPGQPYSRKKRCQTRLKLLFHYGYLHRDEQPTRPSERKQPLVYTLDKAGIEYLAGELKLEPKQVARRSNPQLTTTSFPFLQHILMTNHLHILMLLAARQAGFAIKDWRDEQTLRETIDRVKITGPQGGVLKVAVVPDAYALVSRGRRDFHLLIEVDLKSVVLEYVREENRDWVRKIKAYIAYYDEGIYQARYPAAGKSMRVVTVTLGEERLANLVELAEKVAGKRKRRFWFSSFERLSVAENVLSAAVWTIPGRDGLHPLVW
jgi:hypothetical protein